MRISTFLAITACTLTLAGCPSDGNNPGGNGNADGLGDGFGGDDCELRVQQIISQNHGHTLDVNDISDIDINGISGTRAVELRGTAGHAHAIEVTQAHLQQLGDGGAVNVQTTINALHNHTLTATLSLSEDCGGSIPSEPDDEQDGG